jgi:hypothetical protein
LLTEGNVIVDNKATELECMISLANELLEHVLKYKLQKLNLNLIFFATKKFKRLLVCVFMRNLIIFGIKLSFIKNIRYY